MVHRSLLAWLPTPSLTHVPPLVSWQYEDPLMICHMVPVTTGGSGDGGEGDGGGGGGDDGGGGGGEGDGGGGGGGDGGGGGGNCAAVGLVLPQMVKPPLVTEPSVYHVMVAPTAICTLAGPAAPL